ncbi:Hint domain-containing protein [Paracoccus sp. R12_1]|uniref:Hint domain-containing protein n=1 Tax=unclassified Paracoccus (in: a-proteobacteria) TaxID=2688777 RepID=UPI001ADC0283|nr:MULTISPECIES: Hint domain-containing protein [unclassified Paracoccus (in: a-proteobacteria)]MBO9453822.1 Hint domain-containing protein [Paracoccus sp. R12_2]MBO9486754.1 Hint domain-containing protein [Paracoccus sp. R12_1]
MPTTWDALYMGRIATNIDTTEGNNLAENRNATSVLGTYGNGGNRGGLTQPLYDSVATITTQDNVTPSTSLTANNTGGAFDFFQADRNGDGTPENYNFDGLFSYNATLNYFDGTTSNSVVLVAQMTNGDMYLVPPSSAAAENPALTAKAISSVRLTSAESDQTFNLSRDRQVPEFACFAAGTLIETPEGTVPVEALAVGDLVTTADGGPRSIRWVGSARIDLTRASHLRPVRISSGALGPDQPSRDLVVSPQHRILIRSAIAQRMFGTTEVLVAAKQLLQIDGIDTADDMADVTYVHFMFDAHQLVCSNGAMTESLFTGPQAMKSVGAEARREILELFPEIEATPAEPARPLVKGRKGRRLAERHAANGRVLVS